MLLFVVCFGLMSKLPHSCSVKVQQTNLVQTMLTLYDMELLQVLFSSQYPKCLCIPSRILLDVYVCVICRVYLISVCVFCMCCVGVHCVCVVAVIMSLS